MFDRGFFHGGAYTDYGPGVADFDADAAELVARYAPATAMVVGCAYGYGVHALRALGVQAAGIDISAWAVSRAASPHVAEGDVRSLQVPPAGPVDVVIDEDMLVYLSDADAIAACQRMRPAGSLVVHRVSVHPIEPGPYAHRVRPLSEWAAVCDPEGLDCWHVYQDWAA